MVDILAALDAAIDRIAAHNSRDSRQQMRAETVTGTGNPLGYKVIPVAPVIPVPKQGNREKAEWCHSRINTKKTGSRAHEYIPFSTGITGTTGIHQHSCGFERSREAEIEREVTGTTGIGSVALDLDRLDPDLPPGDVPRHRWIRFLEDARAFHASGFAVQAKALGWSDADLFGCDRDRPFARIDQAGLVWLLNGNKLVAVSENTAIIEFPNGVRQTWRRKPGGPGRVLAWELAQ